MELKSLSEWKYQLTELVAECISDLKGHFNPIQAEVLTLFLIYLLSNNYQTWHDSTMAQNLSKAVKVISIMTLSNWKATETMCL